MLKAGAFCYAFGERVHLQVFLPFLSSPLVVNEIQLSQLQYMYVCACECSACIRPDLSGP